MAMSRDVVLRLVGDAESAKRALHESAEAAGVTVREYRRAETLQRQQAAQAKRLAAEQQRAAEEVGASMMKMGAVVVGALALGVKAAVDWESAFADVKKVMKDPAMFGTVEAQLRQLTSVLPATHAEIAGVAAAAAQLGVEDRNLASFTKTMIMLGTTTSMNAEEASFAIARFSNIMGTSYAQASNLGSAIVWLGNNFAATEGEIVAMSMRLAGAGKQAGMTEADIFGISTALAAVGIEAEAGGTAMSKFMTNIGNAVRDGGQQLDRFAKLAGTTAADFAKQWREDPAKALASVVTGMGNLQKAGGDLNGELDKLGITEIRMRDALLRSSAAGDTLTDAITGANNAFAENNALQEEAQTRYQTTASQLALLRNGVYEAGISLGQALLPALNAVVDAVGFVVDGFNSLPGPIKSSIAILMGIVGASALAGGAMINLKGQAAELRGAFATMTGAGGWMGKLGGFLGMLGPIAAGVGIVTAAVSILSGVFSDGGSKVEGYADYVDELTAALLESNGAINDNIRAIAAKKVADELAGDKSDALARAMKNVGLEASQLTDAILDHEGAYDQVIGQIDEYIAGLDKTSNSYGAYKSQAELLRDHLVELRGGMSDAAQKAKLQAEAAGESSDAMGGQASAAEAAGMSTDEYAQAQADAADAAAETKKAVDELKSAFDRLNGANIDMLQATSSMTLALQGMKQQVEQNGASLDASTEGGAKNTQMLIDMAKKAGDVVTATLQQTGSIEQANAAYAAQREALLNSAEAAGLNRSEVEALLDQIFQMPSEVSVPVEMPGINPALATLVELGATIQKTPDGKRIVVDSLTDEAKKKLQAVGLLISEMPDGTQVVVSAPGAAGAAAAIDGVHDAAENLSEGETVTILAPGATTATGQINETGQAAIQLSNGEIVPISAPGATQATSQIQGTTTAANNVPGYKNIHISADTAAAAGNLSSIQNMLANIRSKSITVAVSTAIYGPALGAMAALGLSNGGRVEQSGRRMIKTFADGGRENHTAQYARPGTWRVWAEPETGGEWYIPDALSKRPRSMSIASRMLDGWGMQMVPKGAQQYGYGAYAYGQHAYGSPTYVGSGQSVSLSADVVRAELHVNDGALAGMIGGVVELKLSTAARRSGTVVTR